jgi:DNA mismatch repair ATPase MutS
MKSKYDTTPLTGDEKLTFSVTEEIPTLKDCVLVLTAFAAEANKCTPELQAVMAMYINKASHPLYIVNQAAATKGSNGI